MLNYNTTRAGDGKVLTRVIPCRLPHLALNIRSMDGLAIPQVQDGYGSRVRRNVSNPKTVLREGNVPDGGGGIKGRYGFAGLDIVDQKRGRSAAADEEHAVGVELAATQFCELC